jgi:hypothetical protein
MTIYNDNPRRKAITTKAPQEEPGPHRVSRAPVPELAIGSRNCAGGLAPIGFSKKTAARRVLFSFSWQRKKAWWWCDSLFGTIIIRGKGTDKALPLPCPLFPSRTKSGSIGKDARLRSHRGKQ